MSLTFVLVEAVALIILVLLLVAHVRAYNVADGVEPHSNVRSLVVKTVTYRLFVVALSLLPIAGAVAGVADSGVCLAPASVQMVPVASQRGAPAATSGARVASEAARGR